jgi:hypothetical protein
LRPYVPLYVYQTPATDNTPISKAKDNTQNHKPGKGPNL